MSGMPSVEKSQVTLVRKRSLNADLFL